MTIRENERKRERKRKNIRIPPTRLNFSISNDRFSGRFKLSFSFFLPPPSPLSDKYEDEVDDEEEEEERREKKKERPDPHGGWIVER